MKSYMHILTQTEHLFFYNVTNETYIKWKSLKLSTIVCSEILFRDELVSYTNQSIDTHLQFELFPYD